MKPGTLFYVVVGLIQGYVLWSYAIVTPRWTVMPGYPMPEPGGTVRFISILLIIAAAFVINLIITKVVGMSGPVRVFVGTVISANVALVFTLLLSQLLDKMFEMPSPLLGDTIWQLTNNPSILFAIVIAVNIAALISFAAGWVVHTIFRNPATRDADGAQ